MWGIHRSPVESPYKKVRNAELMMIWDHYSDGIMGTVASQITSLTIVYSTVNSGTDQRKHQNSASLVFVQGIHRWLMNSQHKGPVTRKMFPFDDVIMRRDAHRVLRRCDSGLFYFGVVILCRLIYSPTFFTVTLLAHGQPGRHAKAQ